MEQKVPLLCTRVGEITTVDRAATQTTSLRGGEHCRRELRWALHSPCSISQVGQKTKVWLSDELFGLIARGASHLAGVLQGADHVDYLLLHGLDVAEPDLA